MAALVGFEKAVEEHVQAQFSQHSSNAALRITIKFQPGGKASYELATQGEIDKASLQQLWVEIEKLAPPSVKQPVAFAVDFEIGD